MRWTIAGLTLAVLYLWWPLWPALVLAAWTAAMATPLRVRFERRLKTRRRATVAVSLLLLVGFLLPLGLLVLAVVSGAQQLSAQLEQSSSATSALSAIAAGDDAARFPEVPTTLPAAMEMLQRYGAEGASVLKAVTGAAAHGLVGLFLYFAAVYVILLDGVEVWAWCKRHSPLEVVALERFARAFHETGRGLIVGVGLTGATQGVIATIAYVSLGIPRWWVLGPITGLAAIVPLVGSAIVWLPITIGLFLTGHPIKGTILAVIGVAVISTADNVLRPVFARVGALKLPTFLLYLSVFGGLAVVGAWGAILGPLVARLWMEAVVMRREAAERLDDRENERSG